MRSKKNVISVLAATFVVLTPLLAINAFQSPGESADRETFPTFNSYLELRSFVLERINSRLNPPLIDALPGVRFIGAPQAGRLVADAAQQPVPKFSKTNIQVEGVDEPDIVKSDGRYVYASTRGSVYIILAYPPEQSKIIAKLELPGRVLGLFISLDRLIVVREGEARKEDGRYAVQTVLTIYDTTEKPTPKTVSEISFEGAHLNSRLSGTYLYSIIQQQAVQYKGPESITIVTPAYVQDSRKKSVEANSIYYHPYSTDASIYTVILSLRIADGQLNQKVMLTGWGSVVYASLSNLYITFTEYGGPIPLARTAWTTSMGLAAPIPQPKTTAIYRIAISEGRVNFEAKNSVVGNLFNQFSMDEHKGYFRVATTSFQWKPEEGFVEFNNLYVLDQDMKVIGSLEGLAPNEKIYSVRFTGDRAYLVTFKKVDPLFAISLEDPARPKVLGELKIPGFSQYLHPIGNGYLLGIGKEAVEASTGNFAWFQGLKLSLFHIDNQGNPVEVAKYLIGDRGTDSPVLYDHKAFLYDPETKAIVVPVLLAQLDRDRYGDSSPPNAYGTLIWQGVYVLRVSTQDGFRLLGKITHLSPGKLPLANFDFHIKRSLLIGAFFYTLSDRMLKISTTPDFADLSVLYLV